MTKMTLLKIIILFIYLFLAALGLHYCAQALSCCDERGLLSSCGAWASQNSDFSCYGAQTKGPGLSDCSSEP